MAAATEEQKRLHERKVRGLERHRIARNLNRPVSEEADSRNLPPYVFPETQACSKREVTRLIRAANARRKRRLEKSPLSDEDRVRAANSKKAEARIVTALIPVVTKVKDFLRSEDRSTKATNIQRELFKVGNPAKFGLDLGRFGLTRYRIKGRRFLQKIRQASR